MSRQPSSSSSISSSSLPQFDSGLRQSLRLSQQPSPAPQFDSGLRQSMRDHSLEDKYPLSPPKSPGSPASGGTMGLSEIRYDELKFEKSLGKGAYGEVFAGTYRKSKVAIKVYDFRGQLTPEQQAGVYGEAELMEGLRSEYLVGYRGICFDPRYCLVMEYCEGGTLRARLNNLRQEITLPEQMRWVKQISYGLYQLHKVRIVHRDLKGENILLDSLNHAKVADFGLSVVKSGSASQSKKGGDQGSAGTMPWMAPELFDRKSNSSETDVYSLGIVIWEILSRKSPFAEVMPRVIVGMVLMGKREDLPEKCPELFRRMITACWDADPKRRPTAEAVGDQFEAALRSVEGIPKTVPAKKEEKLSVPGIRQVAPGESDFQQGLFYYNQCQYTKALPCFTQAIKYGFPPGYLYLGRMSENGRGVTKDQSHAKRRYQEAGKYFSWFKSQAETNDPQALFHWADVTKKAWEHRKTQNRL